MTIKTGPELDALVMKHARPNCAQTNFLAIHEALDRGFYGKRVDVTDPEQVQAYAAAGGREHCLSVRRASVKAAEAGHGRRR
jgi:hypothetical protein